MSTEAHTEHPGTKAPPEIPEELLDSDAVKVVRKLRRAGHQAYLVGGCVRDLLLRIRPKDFDVATSAHPNEVKETFRNSRLIGRRFRLAHVFFSGKIIEVSTFRANPLDELQDLPADLLIRHDNVFGSAEEDARRRDFTINGLFYDVAEGRVIDYVGGRDDLRARLVRTIGNPDVRMREDPVRILRAIRFAAKCAFDVEPNTLAAMQAHVHEIPRCAPPRVLEEVLKLLRSGASRRCFELLRQVRALRILLPPVAAYLEKGGLEEAERHLRALTALDAHVRVGEIPSDAVLLATLLAPLPRDARGPVPRAAQAPAEAAPAEKEEGADGSAPGRRPEAGALDDEELDRELSALEESSEEEEAAAASPEPGAEDPAQAPLPEGALVEAAELHDERLGGISAFAATSETQAWSLPQDVVAPEIVLSEMVRTARLPRRIAERARMILLAQPILSGERRRRRSSPQAFARQSYFPEALAVFELSVAATGQGHDQLVKWQQTFAGQDLSKVERDDDHPGRGDVRKRRRRRGGRGRKRQA
ncbi:MAG TPA: polynucleotide adenylyltransferase PcnB [Myxococcales bacterium]|nr:polynucleotide adenylyltransferase PcnB [Myxococcales bacterium]